MVYNLKPVHREFNAFGNPKKAFCTFDEFAAHLNWLAYKKISVGILSVFIVSFEGGCNLSFMILRQLDEIS